jgi:choline dehydrogenase
MRESSRGFVKIQSRNMNDHPIIDPNYLDTNEDREEFIEAIKLTRKIFA